MQVLLPVALLMANGWANVCVRDYGKAAFLCESHEGFAWVRSIGDDLACARKAPDKNCVIAPTEHRYVKSVTGKPFCTVHYDQETLVNLCERFPEWYVYVEESEELPDRR